MSRVTVYLGLPQTGIKDAFSFLIKVIITHPFTFKMVAFQQHIIKAHSYYKDYLSSSSLVWALFPEFHQLLSYL